MDRNENTKSPSEDESNDVPNAGAGDVYPKGHSSKQLPSKSKTPPPVRPRPTTARGVRTPSKPTEIKQANSAELTANEQNFQSTSHRTMSDVPSTSRDTSSRKPGRSYVSRVKEEQKYEENVNSSEQERIVGEQGRFLMNLFINQRAERSPQGPIIRDVCQADDRNAQRVGFTDESLNDIAFTLRRIGDDISQSTELNNFIEQVPVHSTKEIFMKVCMQIFQDGDLNWGRIVALFYFAYRLIVRTLAKGMDSVPWVRDMLTWAGDVLVRNVVQWVCGRGGWKMMKEWFGPSNRTMMLLCIASITFGLWAYFRKN